MTAFLAALEQRHLANLTRSEFTKAVRALSARYVERRDQLPTRSPLDSAGKRAAFGLFYAPLHMLTVDAALRDIAPESSPAHIIDLGCGTGVCSAAWARRTPAPSATIDGFDLHPWALDEARWNWRTLGLRGRAVRLDAVTALERAVAGRTPLADTGVIAGWAVNELDASARTRLLTAIQASIAKGASVLILEPLARGVAPWWDDWVRALTPHHVVAGDYKFDVNLPPRLAEFSDGAGFNNRTLSARVLWVASR